MWAWPKVFARLRAIIYLSSIPPPEFLDPHLSMLKVWLARLLKQAFLSRVKEDEARIFGNLAVFQHQYLLDTRFDPRLIMIEVCMYGV